MQQCCLWPSTANWTGGQARPRHTRTDKTTRDPTAATNKQQGTHATATHPRTQQSNTKNRRTNNRGAARASREQRQRHRSLALPGQSPTPILSQRSVPSNALHARTRAVSIRGYRSPSRNHACPTDPCARSPGSGGIGNADRAGLKGTSVGASAPPVRVKDPQPLTLHSQSPNGDGLVANSEPLPGGLGDQGNRTTWSPWVKGVWPRLPEGRVPP